MPLYRRMGPNGKSHWGHINNTVQGHTPNMGATLTYHSHRLLTAEWSVQARIRTNLSSEGISLDSTHAGPFFSILVTKYASTYCCSKATGMQSRVSCTTMMMLVVQRILYSVYYTAYTTYIRPISRPSKTDTTILGIGKGCWLILTTMGAPTMYIAYVLS
jgi:hypothetical protein